MYERNEVSNRAQGVMGGSTLLTAGLPGQGYIDSAQITQSLPPVHQAMEELEKEVAYMREQVSMLIGCIHPICKPLPKDAGAARESRPVYCELEGRINTSKANVAEISGAVYAAREALCI